MSFRRQNRKRTGARREHISPRALALLYVGLVGGLIAAAVSVPLGFGFARVTPALGLVGIVAITWALLTAR